MWHATAPSPRRWRPVRAAARHGLWAKGAGAAALALIEALAAEADAGGIVGPQEYRALFQSLIAAREVPEEAVVAHPGLAIWGTLEARVQAADRLILGGLDEGVWPRLPGADPWLDRALRRQLGLPSPEAQVGLAAHDFQQAAGAREVVLTRAIRDAEAPTVASRWLLRLENLLAGLPPEGPEALAAARARGARWLALADRVAAPEASVPPARRPAPRPPAAARPARLSVSDVDRLVRDPYAVYARKVLGLRPLDPPGRKADPLTRGNAIHAALDAFVERTLGGLGARRRGGVPRHGPRGLRPRGALAGGQRALDRAADAGRALVPRRRGRAPRRRHARGPRGGGQPPARRHRRDHHRPRRPHRPHGRRLGDLRLQVRVDPEPRRRRRALPAAADRGGDRGGGRLRGAGGRAGRAARADPLRRQGAGGDPPRPGRGRRDLGPPRRAGRPLPRPGAGFVARLRPSEYPGDYDHLSRWGEWADGDEADPEPWA